MTVIPLFKPHSRTKRDSGASADLMQSHMLIHTQTHLRRPAASPEAAGQLWNALIAVAVFGLVGAVFWWAAQ